MTMFTAAARVAVFAGVATLYGCGGGGGGGSVSEGTDAESVGIDTLGTLADGRVGDNPFYDDGISGGFADGMRGDGERSRTVTIRWNRVTRRIDGNVENELAGYRVYFGSQAGNYEYVVEVPDPGAESVLLPGLPQGTHYFMATAVDRWDNESACSNVSTITIN